MPGLTSLALTTQQTVEILSLYSTADRNVEAVAAAPGWNVIGAFPISASATILLDAIGSVSNSSLTMTLRLYDITPSSVGPVSGSALLITSTTSVHVYSAAFDIVGGHQYQVQAQVVGAAGAGLFGNAHRVAPASV